ncbi:MAG: universal stress protein, partial [Solirubrobacterales bacterium]
GGPLAEQLDSQFYEEAARELEGTDFTRASLDGGLSGRSAARALYEYADDQGANLIVVGSSHRGKVGRVLAGSVGESLLRGAPCAVAIAPRGLARGDHARVGLIGVAYDGSEEADLALAEAGRLARAFEASLRVIAVVPELTPLSFQALDLEAIQASIRQEYEEALNEAVAGLDEEIAAEAVLKEGDPAATLSEQGAELDLIVIGSRGYGPVRAALLGAVSAQLVRTAPCPVLVTPRASGGADGA